MTHFLESQVALEWWRASGARSVERLTSLVAHQTFIRAIADQPTKDAILADALANRHPWEITP